MASVHLSYPCDHCSSKILPSVVCGDVGSSTPVSTLLKDAVRLAYDFKKQKPRRQCSYVIPPTHGPALAFHVLSRVCVLCRNRLCGNAGCPSQGQCNFSVPSKLKVQPLQSCSDVQGTWWVSVPGLSS